MPYMVMTLDVSKLSGWLNFDAICRVERRAYDAGRGVGREAEGRGVTAVRAACTGKAPGGEGCGGLRHARSAPRT